jgi:phytoene dehydrogenase-like protein
MPSVIVIGGGVAGLSAGVYAAKNGYDTTVFEMHSIPGGLCTSWEREGYTFDGCIHWFVGGEPGSGFYPMWKEVGALDGIELISHDRLATVCDDAGNELTLWSDLEKLRSEMLAKWPGDAKAIEAFIEGARTMAEMGGNIPLTPPDMMKAWDGVKMLLKSGNTLRKVRKYQDLTCEDIGATFSDPFLRRAICHAITAPEMSSMPMLGTLGWFDAGDANWVAGGSRKFAEGIERSLKRAGGQIHYRSRVERILVENDRAVGVRLADGSEHRADYVISAADGHATIFDMLEGRYADDRIRNLYDNMELFPAIVQVSLGIDRDMGDEPWSIITLLEPAVNFAGCEVGAIWAHHYSYDPSMAPPGKSVVTAFLDADYDYWMQLRAGDREKYRAEKAAVADKVIDQVIEKAWPGTREHIEVIDVATPATFDRYTGNWKGSFEGWLLSPENTKLAGMAGMPRTLPGLSNFVMAGQWVWPGGGLPSGVLTGRWAVTSVMAVDGKAMPEPA